MVLLELSGQNALEAWKKNREKHGHNQTLSPIGQSTAEALALFVWPGLASGSDRDTDSHGVSHYGMLWYSTGIGNYGIRWRYYVTLLGYWIMNGISMESYWIMMDHELDKIDITEIPGICFGNILGKPKFSFAWKNRSFQCSILPRLRPNPMSGLPVLRGKVEE